MSAAASFATLDARYARATPDARQTTRHAIDHPFIAEHARAGDLRLRMVNISTEGFMAMGAPLLDRGERLLMRLPVIGRIEAHLTWHRDCRAGFKFERIIRPADFVRLLNEVEPTRRIHAND